MMRIEEKKNGKKKRKKIKQEDVMNSLRYYKC